MLFENSDKVSQMENDSPLTFSEFLELVMKTFDERLRFGQHWFNALYAVRPEIANRVRGSLLDPFHRDKISPELITFVEQAWNAETV